ncbi:DNA segregation ATPase FtsK/SpoIIIE, S-DNA-T family [Marinactinospora thermotolerans DSM 45154]|uniref:DNA segregation ATPase FtsK/SpoIIIE, S-DNA-T family n=1 Tax=Marinactinospora thermotolerans DSM 45154 TaxID=1122192 RepID=A0A1T4R317_9ACTN|nr:type VII secretion protein EccCa [Marinactinospora thermotolerans]SKA10420.1 DNA segregation ATPase FtsK/SpoIIIE, S-DNA-T family [Marinactinospora thermotolerans DSM 45154]
MTTRTVHRPARTVHPLPPEDPHEVEAPPTLPEGNPQGNQLLSLLPMIGMVLSLTVMMVMRNPAFMVLGAVVLVVALLGGAVMLLSRRGQAARQRRTQRELYLEYLEGLREELGERERAARARARLLDPPPEALYDIVRDPARLWERRRRDRDFLRVRIGTGLVPGRPLRLAERGSALTPTDPFMLSEARAAIRRFEAVPEMPLTLPLDMVGDVSVVGGREDVLRLVRVLLAQLGSFHAPEDVALAVMHPEGRSADWAWAKWLPQVLDRQRREAGVNARLIASSPAGLGALLADELRSRTDFAAEVRRGVGRREAYRMMSRLVVVHDTHGEDAVELVRPDEAVGPADLGVTVLHLVADRIQEPGEVSLRLTVTGDQVVVEDLRGEEARVWEGTVDDVPAATLEGLARMLAPLRLSRESVEETTAEGGSTDFPSLMGVSDPGAMDVERLWAPRSERAFLRVPIGVDDMGQPVILDLKEAAQLGMGPHGLCVGATGSGKSEMLRTLVIALAAAHPPERVSMVLVDYKGGATFAPFETLPHVAGVITNLEDDAALIERVHASLSGEVQRRQQVLRDAGNVANIGDYTHLRTRNPGLPPLPHLLVIIDEFGELLTARPDFIELFLSIGRIGRSIGVHLLLSSQRIESGKLRGLETYLSYRLGLRTFSEEESRTVLDTPDAFHLPSLPGFGYLKVDTTVYQRFKAGYVSGPYRGPVAEEDEEERGGAVTVRPYPAYNVATAPGQGAVAAGDTELPERSSGPTLLDVMVSRLARHGDPVRGIWLPPLPPATTLDMVTGPVRIDGDAMRLPGDRAPLRVPVGLLDDPARQWQGVWELDLTASGGHLAIIGGPQTGKTTLLRTMVLSIALTHSPSEVSVYALDLVGGGLQALSDLPHVGGVATRTDPERVRRTVEELRDMLEQRQEVFRERGVDSIRQLRRMHARGEVPELESADVVLCVDGFGAIRSDFEEIDDMVSELLQRGGGYGIHVVAAMLRWNDVRMAAQSNFGQKVELRLNDPTDSSVDRKLAETIGADVPGRALTDRKLFGQVALPRVDALADAADLGEVVEKTSRAVASAWRGPTARPVRVLPHRLPAAALPDPGQEELRVPIGVDERALEPVLLDLFGRDQNLLVLGDGECGKTNLLRLVAEGLIARYTPEEVVFAVMDPRRTLRGVIPEPYLGGYASNARVCAGLAGGVAKELEGRMPDDTDPDRSAGDPPKPRVVVLVDDYDVLTTAGQKPLSPFVPFVSNGRDIGLHFVVTRRVAGAGRGMYDPLVQAMREIGTSALIMSGDRGEGQLLPRVYAGPQPPGRGRWIRWGEAGRLIQTGLLDVEEER